MQLFHGLTQRPSGRSTWCPGNHGTGRKGGFHAHQVCVLIPVPVPSLAVRGLDYLAEADEHHHAVSATDPGQYPCVGVPSQARLH